MPRKTSVLRGVAAVATGTFLAVGSAGAAHAAGGNGAARGQTLPTCSPAQVNAQLTNLQPGAGNRHATLVLQNSGSKPCQLSGWVDLQLKDDQYNNVPTDVFRKGRATRPVTLRPGASAAQATLRWSTVPTGGENVHGPCQPEPSTVDVTLPGTTKPVMAAWPYGPVCGHGRIMVKPLVPAPQG